MYKLKLTHFEFTPINNYYFELNSNLIQIQIYSKKILAISSGDKFKFFLIVDISFVLN